MSKIQVKFLIDKEKKRVVFAEAGSDFVDVLFSFLTLPLGKIVRLLNKQSCLGSLDNLYESVEQLDAKHLQTETCKQMLLDPRSPAAELCEDLEIQYIDDRNPRNFYICQEKSCLAQSTGYYTYTLKEPCSGCGKLMDKGWQWHKTTSDETRVFVNDTTDFMITDDLLVMPISLMKGCSLLNEMQIKEAGILEERVIEFGTEEILNLFRRSLVSKNALTEVCFPDACVRATAHFSVPIIEELDANNSEHEIMLKLLINKENNDVLYAEVGGDFVNQLLSFLAFPLGSLLSFLPDAVSLGGCINNLHLSAKTLDLSCFKSEVCRNMLAAPKLSSFYGIKNQILEIEEIMSRKLTISGCMKCYSDNEHKSCDSPPCIHGISDAEIIEQNPKSTEGVTDKGGDFVVGSRKFMVSDNLRISSLSLISAIANGTNHFDEIISKEVCLDKNKAQLLLGAMLVSESVLSDVFCPKPMLPRKSHCCAANAIVFE